MKDQLQESQPIGLSALAVEFSVNHPVWAWLITIVLFLIMVVLLVLLFI